MYDAESYDAEFYEESSDADFYDEPYGFDDPYEVDEFFDDI